MAHTAQLKIESKNYNVIECAYKLIKPLKKNGQPSGFSRGEKIEITVVSPEDSDMLLHDWMQSATDHKDGKIIFSVVDTGSPSIKTLHFKKALCMSLYEYFNSQNSVQMLTKISIEAAEISFGGGNIVFKNDEK